MEPFHRNSEQEPDKSLRIACLLPSATDICVALGLAPFIVGVTHECNIQSILQGSTNSGEGLPYVLTENGLSHVSSQRDIHEAVVQQQARQDDQEVECSSDKINSLYPIVQSEWDKARPKIVFTQDLCSVCAPSPADMKRVIADQDRRSVQVVSLHPNTLAQVADSFVTVSTACGVPDRGEGLRNRFMSDLERLKTTIASCRPATEPTPRVFLLEWLDPPFDGGHWILQMMDYACVRPARPSNSEKTTVKSEQISWDTVASSQPDVVLVACCGLDLNRNIRDVKEHRHRFLSLGGDVNRNVFACDGHTYFACPGPNLVAGTAILAQCAYHKHPAVLQAIQNLSLIQKDSPKGWEHVTCLSDNVVGTDMEDLVVENDFAELHKAACEAGDMSYKDPATGYHVFTELAHKKRGKCCGSGCRHCPYSHENVVDKVNRIKQPAFLYRNEKTGSLFSLNGHHSIKVLFFSGGKDSFLTIRSLVQAYKTSSPFGLVLLTTFDSQSRIIAHQETHIETVLRQAEHLDISLVGIPMHRGSRERYMDRIRCGLDVVEASLARKAKISALVFGDLHLQHIRQWRDKELGRLDYALEYPLWRKPYSELMENLEESKVPCRLSASTQEGLDVGALFNKEFSKKLVSSGLDGFGENGEFHTVAEVWETTREEALGI